jgi:hypothetical protein
MATFWLAAVQLATVIRNDPSDELMLWIYLCGILPAMIYGSLSTFIHKRRYNPSRWIDENAEEEGVTYIVTRTLEKENEVDLIVRECMRAADRDDQWVEKAEAIFSTALQVFSNSSRIHILYGIFLEFVKKDKSGGKFHLDQALRLSPSLQERFALYLNEQELKKQHAVSVGDSSMDLVSYIEFQGHYNNAIKSHKKLLMAIRHFWKLICRSDNPPIGKYGSYLSGAAP